MCTFIVLPDGSSSPAFRYYGSLSGSIGDVIYEVPDFTPDFKGVKTFSKIRMQYMNGELFFSFSDLQDLKVIE